MLEIVTSFLIGISLSVVGAIVVFVRLSRNKTIALIDWTIIFSIALYGIGFPVIYLASFFGANVPNKAMFIMKYQTIDIIMLFTYLFLLVFFSLLGWYLLGKSNNVKMEHNKINNSSEIDLKYLKKFKNFAWIMLFISIVTYFLYSLAYGGFIGLLSNTIAIRSGVSNVDNPFSFFQKFGQFSFISALSFFALFLDKNVKKKLGTSFYIGFTISTIFSLYVAYSWGGRGLIVELFLVYILGALYLNSSKISTFITKFSKQIILLPVLFLVVDRLWSRSGGLDFFTLAISAASYPFIAFIVNLENSVYRYFIDIAVSPLFFLPSSIWQVKLNIGTTNSITTYLTQGAEKGGTIGGKIVTGTATNDLLTFSYMQGNIIGVIIIGILFGMFLRFIHNKIAIIKFEGIKFVFYSYAIVRFAIGIVKGGDISQVIIGNWGFFIYILIFTVYKKVKY